MHRTNLLRELLGVRLSILIFLPLAAAVSVSQAIPSNNAEKVDDQSTFLAAVVPDPASNAATKVRVSEAYGKLPLYFEANQGQTDPRVKFLSRGPGHALFLTPTDAVLVLSKPEQTASRKPQTRERMSGM
jgi:hypothetical protein